MILVTKSSKNKQTNKQTNKQNRIKLQIKQWYILPLVILIYVDKGGENVDVDIMSSFLRHFLSVVVFPSNIICGDEQLKYECVMLKLQFNQIEISVIAHVFPLRQMNKCEI